MWWKRQRKEDSTSSMFVVLQNAGYREKVFVKSRLAMLGKVDQFKYALTHYLYDPVRDEIRTAEGAVWEILWGTEESRKILENFGYDDSDC